MYEIFKITSDTPVDFAAQELQKYLRMMMPSCGAISIKFDPLAKEGIRLGLMQDFGIDVSEAEDPVLDDIIHLEKDEKGQIIAGSNPRSVLLAVYKFLKLNGCRWLFPGVDGEFIPMKEVEYLNYHKMADNRFRGQCNEGTTDQQNYMDIIDFLPKIGMNIYMIEFEVPAAYYQRWYEHQTNPTLPDERVTNEQILQWKRQCECEIQKRGLQFHDMGHGFTTAPFGLSTIASWTREKVAISDEVRNYLALTNGARGLFNNVIMKTNFCMSNPKARKVVVDYVADYAVKQNNVDFLHVWLADGKNCHCECDECKKETASDWYVVLLNEIDEELTRRHCDVRVAFIAYLDTMYPPEVEKIKNPKRFSLLFAPHTRVYTENYQEDSDPSKFIPFIRNNNIVPKGVGACMAYLDKWREAFNGNAMCYEYHFWRMQLYDPTYQYLAHNIYDDIHGLKKHNLQGIIEDQTPRNYMPSGLAQTVYAEALFDLSLTFEEIEEDYMSHAFGANWKKVSDFLTDLSDIEIFKALSQNNIYDKNANYVHPELLQNCKNWIEKCKAFRKTVDENQHLPVRSQTVLWRNMYFFLDHMELEAELWAAKFAGDARKAYETYFKIIRALGPREMLVQKMWDLDLWGIQTRPLANPGGLYDDIP